MRPQVALILVLSLIVFGNAFPALSQEKDALKVVVEDPKAREVLRTLEFSLNVKDFNNPMTFKEFLGLTKDKLAEAKKTLSIEIDAKAFAAQEVDLQQIHDSILFLSPQSKEMPVGLLLQLAVDQLSGEACWVARSGRVEITTKAAAGKK